MLGSMRENGVELIVDAGSDIASWDKIEQLTDRYPFIYGAIGVHPDEVGELDEEKMKRMEQLLARERWSLSERSDWIITGIRRTGIYRKCGLSGSWNLRDNWICR